MHNTAVELGGAIFVNNFLFKKNKFIHFLNYFLNSKNKRFLFMI